MDVEVLLFDSSWSGGFPVTDLVKGVAGVDGVPAAGLSDQSRQ